MDQLRIEAFLQAFGLHDIRTAVGAALWATSVQGEDVVFTWSSRLEACVLLLVVVPVMALAVAEAKVVVDVSCSCFRR